MITPNWKHHSKKDQKRHLKPQALRQAKKRAKNFINKLKKRPEKGRFFNMCQFLNCLFDL